MHEQSNDSILNLAFYQFVPLNHLTEWRQLFKTKTAELGLKGTILVSEEGINCFLAGLPENIRGFKTFLESTPPFKPITGRESWSNKVPFNRMLVRLKKEIISMGMKEIEPARETGPRIEPEDLKKWYEDQQDFLIVDTRNDYELKIGTFENAIDLNLKTFREFPEKLRDFVRKNPEAKNRPVVMFCTGGIRCEKATALAMKEGLTNVYQLEGGILNYFEKAGGAHWNGECFVFDHRVALNPDLKATGTSVCFDCRAVLAKTDGPHLCPNAGKSLMSQSVG